MKKLTILLTIISLFLIATVCAKEKINIDYKTNNYSGIIKEITDTAIIVESESEDLEFIISDASKIKNSETAEAGDEITIKCQENTTSNEKTIISATIKKQKKINYKSDIRMVFVNDTLYLESKSIDNLYLENFTDGTITNIVDSNTVPFENDTSNFEKNIMYTISEDCVYININDKPTMFIKDTEDIIRYNEKAYYKSELSEDTVKWLEKYNEMSKEQQITITFVPPEFVTNKNIENVEAITTNAKTFSQNSGMIELPGGEIYIQIESLTIKDKIELKFMLYNDSDDAYNLNSYDFSIIGMSKMSDGFTTLKIIDDSNFPIRIEAKTLVSETLHLEKVSNSLLEELYIKSDSGMYRISEKNITRGY